MKDAMPWLVLAIWLMVSFIGCDVRDIQKTTSAMATAQATAQATALAHDAQGAR